RSSGSHAESASPPATSLSSSTCPNTCGPRTRRPETGAPTRPTERCACAATSVTRSWPWNPIPTGRRSSSWWRCPVDDVDLTHLDEARPMTTTNTKTTYTARAWETAGDTVTAVIYIGSQELGE